MKHTSLIITQLMLLFLSACNSFFDESPEKAIPDKDNLPEITYEGRDVIACRVNGEIFLSKYHWTLYGSVGPQIDILYNNILSIYGRDFNSMFGWHISMAAHYTEGQTEFTPDYYLPPIQTGMEFNHGLTTINYSLLQSEPHHLKLLHLDDEIAVGTFAFTAVNDAGDTLRITDGRFDIDRNK